jgi:Helix-turn-helix domain
MTRSQVPIVRARAPLGPAGRDRYRTTLGMATRVVCGQREVRRRDGTWVCGERRPDGNLCGLSKDRDTPCEHLIAAMQALPVRYRVARLRQWRGLAQPELAYAVDRTLSWIEKVERGVRDLDRVSVLLALAEALRVDPPLLLIPPTDRPWIPRPRTATEPATTGSTR